jgi:hypothetical protein
MSDNPRKRGDAEALPQVACSPDGKTWTFWCFLEWEIGEIYVVEAEDVMHAFTHKGASGWVSPVRHKDARKFGFPGQVIVSECQTAATREECLSLALALLDKRAAKIEQQRAMLLQESMPD